MKMNIRGILIDPEKRTIEEVDVTMRTVEEGGAASIRKHIKAELFDTVLLGRNHVIWCDDEGLLKPPPHFFFAITGYAGPITGRGLLTGARGPDTVSTHVGIDLIKDNVTWLDLEFTGFDDREEEKVEIAPGVFGVRMTRTPLFKQKDET